MNYKLKLLVTGNNKRIARDICQHLKEDRGYLTVMCRADKEAIYDVVYSELPNVIVICMSDETSEDVRMYNLLSEAVRSGTITVFAVVDDKDKQMFMDYSTLRRVYFLSRPVSLYALYDKLIALEEEIKARQDDNTYIEEYINPNADISKRKRILVVDDDTQMLINIKEQLSEFYDVFVVKSGEAAIKFFMKKDADLILLDYMMPDMDGPQVLNELREYEETYDIPVIFLSGLSDKDKIVEAITELKPQGYIVKPAKKSELVAKIIDILG